MSKEDLPQSTKKDGIYRYNLVMPENDFNGVEEYSARKTTSLKSSIERFIRQGVFLEGEIEKSADASLVIVDGDKTTEIIFLDIQSLRTRDKGQLA